MVFTCVGGTVQIKNGFVLESDLGWSEDRHGNGNEEFAAALDGVESFLLALAVEGVITPDNISEVGEALNTAYQACCNHFPE